MLCSEAFSLKASVLRDLDGWVTAYGVLPFCSLFLIEDAAGSEGDLTSSPAAPLSRCAEARQATMHCVSVSHQVVLDCAAWSFTWLLSDSGADREKSRPVAAQEG